jgi:hypothetical protein
MGREYPPTYWSGSGRGGSDIRLSLAPNKETDEWEVQTEESTTEAYGAPKALAHDERGVIECDIL